MKIEKKPTKETVIVLDAKETDLLKLALERASFIDTPPDRQQAILEFAEDVLKALAPPSARA